MLLSMANVEAVLAIASSQIRASQPLGQHGLARVNIMRCHCKVEYQVQLGLPMPVLSSPELLAKTTGILYQYSIIT